MKRNFGLPNKDDIDPKVRKFFPWALFLAFALLFAVAALATGERADYGCYPNPYQAIWEDKPPCPRTGIVDRIRQHFMPPAESVPYWECNGKKATNNPLCDDDWKNK